jgi:membrane protein required for colicin V production
LNGIDVAIVIIVIIGAVKGYRSGFLMELFTFVGIVLGILGGFKLMGVMLVLLSDRFDIDEKVLPYVAFGVVFIAVVVVVTLLGKALRASIDKSFLGRIDEVAGAFLGSVKTVFILSVILWLTSSFKIDSFTNWSKNSEFAPYISHVAPAITAWIGELVPGLKDIF